MHMRSLRADRRRRELEEAAEKVAADPASAVLEHSFLELSRIVRARGRREDRGAQDVGSAVMAPSQPHAPLMRLGTRA